MSYANALASRLGPCATGLTASAYEDEDTLLVRYPHASATIASLRSMGASVRYGVDARQLPRHFGEMEWERIVFNLPQAPAEKKARNQIQRHRALLRDFCSSASSRLAPAGQLWITLLAGQGGTPLDPIQRLPGDTWQLQHEAAKAGLIVRAVADVDLDALHAVGYLATGRRGNQNLGARRQSKGMVVHVLTHAAPQAGAEAPLAVAPLDWSFDNSFWLESKDAPAPAALLDHTRAALGVHAAHAVAREPELIDSYTRPEDGRQARTYRFWYSSSVLALSRDHALELNAAVCTALSKYCLEARVPSRETLDGMCESGDGGGETMRGAAGEATGEDLSSRER
jgi:hypothetical protein